MARLTDLHARLSCFPEIVARIDTLRAEMTWAMYESPHASLVRHWAAYGAERETYLPLSLTPIMDRSLIDTAIAVGWHGAPLPDDAPAGLTDDAGRLLMGRLLHAAKQYQGTMWSTDTEDVHALGALAAWAIATTRFGMDLELIAGVPSSRGTNGLPHQVARDIAFLTGIHYAPVDAIRFGRAVTEVKHLVDYRARQDAMHGSMDADPTAVRGRRILLIDDICHSGTTLQESARACWHAGAERVTALALSKTFRFQRIPAQIDESGWWDTTAW